MSIEKIKCLVWDMDNTLWKGILLEDNTVVIDPNVREIIIELDNRGILQSIASKNLYDLAVEELKRQNLFQYFLYPQINMNPKSSSIQAIAKSLNIGMNTIAFIDDQVYERDEVKFSCPQVTCLDATEIDALLNRPEFNPEHLTAESKNRRQMYQSDMVRKKEEEEFEGPKDDFLRSLQMVFTIAPVREDDLSRAEELTVRTNQLNTTGYTYSFDELEAFSKSQSHLLLCAQLDDKYGSYGKIGLALVEKASRIWSIKLLLMSCRVMTRGVGSILLNHIMKLARDAGVVLQAEFVTNDRNRMMLVTYTFAGFKQVSVNDGVILLQNDLSVIQDHPQYLKVQTD